MAEKEYIERGAAKYAIFEYICGHTMSKFPSRELLDASKKGAEGAFNEIDYVPAADVVEVRHGEWTRIEINGKHYGQIYYQHKECSVNETQLFPSPYDYCPNCGAIMDGKK